MDKKYSILNTRIKLILLGFVFGGFYMKDAYGYIDPGSGSVVIQMIIGALVGIGITMKLYWYKFKEKIMRSNKKNEEPQN
jgi:hypothetical protein